MHVYLDKYGRYRNAWSHKILIPSEENLRWIAMLDVAADERGNAMLEINNALWAQRREDGNTTVNYWIPGAGKYEGEREC